MRDRGKRQQRTRLACGALPWLNDDEDTNDVILAVEDRRGRAFREKSHLRLALLVLA